MSLRDSSLPVFNSFTPRHSQIFVLLDSLHLPMELEGALDPGSALEGEIGDFYNGTGIPPSPPTTCYSPLSSLASESASRGVGLDPAASAASGSSRTLNETARKSGSSTFSPYTTALSLAIAIGKPRPIRSVPYFRLPCCFY